MRDSTINPVLIINTVADCSGQSGMEETEQCMSHASAIRPYALEFGTATAVATR